MLEIAVARRLLVLPWDAQENGIRELCAVRNTTLHGNYAQAAQDAGCASVRDYFQTQAAGEAERLFHVIDNLLEQIDPETGRRFPER